MAKLSKNEKVLLKKIEEAGEAGTYAPELELEGLVKAGLVEVAPNVKDSEGNVAVRLLPQSNATKENNVSEENAKVEYVIESNVEMPETQRKGFTKQSKYPFDKLEVGQSFAVPGKDVKSFAGAVAAANKKYAVVVPGQVKKNRKGVEVPVTEQTRTFKIRPIEGGVRVWRTK